MCGLAEFPVHKHSSAALQENATIPSHPITPHPTPSLYVKFGSRRLEGVGLLGRSDADADQDGEGLTVVGSAIEPPPTRAFTSHEKSTIVVEVRVADDDEEPRSHLGLLDASAETHDGLDDAVDARGSHHVDDRKQQHRCRCREGCDREACECV